jgi:hypothetical protein
MALATIVARSSRLIFTPNASRLPSPYRSRKRRIEPATRCRTLA